MKTRKILSILIIAVLFMGCSSDSSSDGGIIVGGPTNGGDDGDGTGGGTTPEYLQDFTNFPMGNIVSAFKLSSTSSANVDFREVLLNDYNSITAENDMKMANIFTSAGNYDFSDGDAIVAYAKANGLRVHGHALVWHSSVPGWLNSFSGTNEEFEALIEAYVKATVSHFAIEKDANGNSIVASWDVVNEYFDGGSIRSSIFQQKIGDDFIDKAFQWAREADTDVKLFYNDYNIAGEPNKRNLIINKVNSMISNSVPIDGIGMQMHLNHNWPTSDLPLAIQQITDTSLLVHISELDVKANYGNDVTELTATRAQEQADQYQNASYHYTNIVPTAQQYGITIWGVRDQDSWLYDGGGDWPLLYNNDYSTKIAYDSFIDGLKGNP
ncbi:endo-1,4-beta-xylanase [Flaviramulus basaltis]|uniref:Beta-xylanase n=1 Tax=Flaviramulus basaltis TaxID=369401 RepID=A0A1K2IHX8_9FLAO|nr:endo-1,4-beta-xylanase [Flaviramulus basaltis]SFZ92045.1 endo-1,4-beta-xylanase [Flaviramulus basaltis]